MAPERGEGQEGSPAAPAPQLPQPVIINGMEGDSRGVEERSEDDDLTSLTWLQDKNLLKGINLRSNGAGGKQESPTSDYVEECGSECSSVTSSSPHPKHPHHIPYDPKVHITSKPPYSFSCLIFMSIEDSEGKALPVKEIYAWILDHFPYYRTAPTGWKNSVRHNLSLNKCFRKVDKSPSVSHFGAENMKQKNLGKGSLWMVDPVFRPNLVQALMKAPYHPYTNIDYSNVNSRSCPVGADEDSSDEIDDVGAAAAMLALKHGPSFTDHYHKRHLHPRVNGVRHQEEGRDHTYSAESPRDLSADEAFASDSNSSWCMMDPEERRKTEEGADALLDLAGVPRGPPPSKRPKRRKPIAPQRTNNR